MKKILPLLLTVRFAIGLLPMVSRAETFETISCAENLPGCRLLQTVMAGSFDIYDPEDTLNGRVLSAVYPQLCAITREDLDHFLQEFPEEEEEVTDRLRLAMANCLWATLVSEPVTDSTTSQVRQILLLFLDPLGQENAEEQMEEIREGMTGELLTLLSDTVGAPQDFIEWLIEEDEWEEHQEETREELP